MDAPVRRCERLALDGFRRGRGRPKKYWGEVIRRDMEQLQLTEDMTLRSGGRELGQKARVSLSRYYFIKLLIEKKYALPYRVLDAMVAHFMNFFEETRVMPVIWHLSLLVFVQRYKTELRKEDKANLRSLVERQRHRLITPDILREIEKSRSRGEKEDDPMSIDILSIMV
ncbi:hypothetical protein BC332_19719 [Capsicum chinense]|nr:hypothetical protein BC332_19719 [Capsicum chinense]